MAKTNGRSLRSCMNLWYWPLLNKHLQSRFFWSVEILKSVPTIQKNCEVLKLKSSILIFATIQSKIINFDYLEASKRIYCLYSKWIQFCLSLSFLTPEVIIKFIKLTNNVDSDDNFIFKIVGFKVDFIRLIIEHKTIWTYRSTWRSSMTSSIGFFVEIMFIFEAIFL